MMRYGEEEEILRTLKGLDDIMGPTMTTVAEIDVLQHAVLKYVFVLLFPIASIIFFLLALDAVSNSFNSSVCLELSSGFFFFAAAPIAIKYGRRHRRLVPIAGAGLSLVLLGIGSCFIEFAQSAFIEFSIALALLVGLEIAIVPWLDTLDKNLKDARETLAIYRQKT